MRTVSGKSCNASSLPVTVIARPSSRIFMRLVKLDRRPAHGHRRERRARCRRICRAGIQAGLARRYGPGLSTAFAQRPALIGGMRIQVGSDVYDGSVRAGLAALEKSF